MRAGSQSRYGLLLAGLVGALVLVGGCPALAESPLTREQQLNQLKLKGQQLLLAQRRENLATFEEERDIAQELFDQGYIALQELKQKQNSFEQAWLNYEKAAIDLEQAKLDLLDNATHIVITQARSKRLSDLCVAGTVLRALPFADSIQG